MRCVASNFFGIKEQSSKLVMMLRLSAGSGIGRSPIKLSRALLTLFFCGVILFFILPQTWNDKSRLPVGHEMGDAKAIDLPKNLQDVVLKRFDDLVQKKSIFFEASAPEYVEHHGFTVSQSASSQRVFQCDQSDNL